MPSSFCGLFGLKPTYGRLSRAGAFPFVASLDHVGPLARSVGDLAVSYDTMLGRGERDPAQADMPATPASPTLDDGIAGLRIARLGGYFARSAEPSAISAVDTIACALKADRVVELGGADQRVRQPISSPWPKAPRFISSGCETALKTSIRTFATG